jgi:hypothetical protein
LGDEIKEMVDVAWGERSSYRVLVAKPKGKR